MTITRTNPDAQHVTPSRIITVVVVVLILGLTNIGPAVAQDADRVQLGVKPVGVDGSYFELTIEPGEARQLTVEFGNFGTSDGIAMVYPADVYSLVNGGMGVRLAGEPTSGMTDWIGLDAETFPLAAGEAQFRTFAVSVPKDAAPGEYVSSIVIQDDTPPASSAADGVAANRVNRQAIAVAVIVPGPASAGLTLGEVAHHVAGGRSVLTVEVRNSGTTRLQPHGELTLTDPTGKHTRYEVMMDSVYAGTSTVAEIAFTTLLEPGEYGIDVTLSDPLHDITVTTGTLPLAVPVSNLPVSAAPDSPNSATIAQPSPPHVDEGQSLPLVPVLAFGALALALGIGGTSWRTRPRRAAPPAEIPAAPVTQSTTIMRPVTIRQLAVPNRSMPSHVQDPPRTVLPRFKKLDAGSRVVATGIHSNGD